MIRSSLMFHNHIFFPFLLFLSIATRYAIGMCVGTSETEDESDSGVGLTRANSVKSPLIHPVLHFLWLVSHRDPQSSICRIARVEQAIKHGPGMD